MIASLLPLDVPVGWGGNQDRDVNLVHAVLFLAGVPLLITLVIVVAVYTPSLVRGESIRPGSPPLENQWIGGPRTSPAELAAGSESGSQSDRPDTDSGGASGRW